MHINAYNKKYTVYLCIKYDIKCIEHPLMPICTGIKDNQSLIFSIPEISLSIIRE